MLDNSNPISKVADYFYRVEYQQRGSPHVHMLLQCKDSPLNGKNDIENVIRFIDSYIASELPPETDPIMRELVKLQTHRHTHTCKKSQNVCSFGFPKPPIDKTSTLKPLSVEFDKTSHPTNWRKIQEQLSVLHHNDDCNVFTLFQYITTQSHLVTYDLS